MLSLNRKTLLIATFIFLRSYIVIKLFIKYGFFLKQSALATATAELQQLRDMSAHQRKRIAELLTNLLRDLAEIGAAVGGSELDFKLNVDTVGKLEEEFTVARLHISKMKSEVKNIVQRCHSLESANIDANQKVGQLVYFIFIAHILKRPNSLNLMNGFSHLLIFLLCYV